MLCGSLMGEEFMGEWRHVYLWLSPFAIHPKLSQQCKQATIQEKRKKFKNNKKTICYSTWNNIHSSESTYKNNARVFTLECQYL